MLTEMPDDVLEHICDKFYCGSSGIKDYISITDEIKHDAVNYTIFGYVLINNIKYYFIVDDGNNAGTVVKYFGLEKQPINYEEDKESISFIPIHEKLYINNPILYSIYMLEREKDWFKEMERNYNYDRHFQPGSVTENHYTEKAKIHWLKPGYFSQFKNKVDKLKSVL